MTEGKHYRFQEGDFPSEVAVRHGFADWVQIWDAPENREVREEIAPSTLPRPGDRVFIPRVQSKHESASTQARHRFRRKRPDLDWIEIRLTNGLEAPCANEEFVLRLPSGDVIASQLNQAGMTRVEVSPSGDVEVEFPSLFDVVVVKDDQAQEPSPRGSRKERPPSLDEDFQLDPIDEPSVAGAPDEPEADSEADSEADWENDPADEGQFEGGVEAADLDPKSDGPAPDTVIRERIEMDVEESQLEETDEHEVAGATLPSGEAHHLAILHCVSVELLRESGDGVELPVRYALSDQDGKLITEDTATNGVIFVDRVGVGVFDLVIEGVTYSVPSTDHAEDVEFVVLPSETVNGGA